MNGIQRIAFERKRQVDDEEYDAIHDRGHGEELATAGAVYALPVATRKQDYQYGKNLQYELWPWGWEDFKPTPDDRIRELTKAGALIAAAIDALLDTGE